MGGLSGCREGVPRKVKGAWKVSRRTIVLDANLLTKMKIVPVTIEVLAGVVKAGIHGRSGSRLEPILGPALGRTRGPGQRIGRYRALLDRELGVDGGDLRFGERLGAVHDSVGV